MHDQRMCLLPDVGVLRLTGPDASQFLQGQVTADLRGLAVGCGTLAALCSPQGRVIALPRLLRTPEGLLAVLPAGLAGTVATRLSRYVLRARVVIEDASGEFEVAGVWPGPVPSGLPDSVHAFALAGERVLIVGPAATVTAACGANGDAGAWQALAVAQGEPEVFAATSEAWIPQMLNLDLLGAISFSKGCYTGQEIVARTQHLGRIKRRMFRYAVSGEWSAAPGAGLYHDGVKVGEVVRTAAMPPTLLAVVNLDAACLSLTDESGGATCVREPLPYAIPEAAAVA